MFCFQNSFVCEKELEETNTIAPCLKSVLLLRRLQGAGQKKKRYDRQTSAKKQTN